MATILEEETTEMTLAAAHMEASLAQINMQKVMHEESQVLEKKRQNLELLKTAKDALIANRSNAPVGEREIKDEEVVAFAATLKKFIET